MGDETKVAGVGPCVRCGAPAVALVRSTGDHLCAAHFVASVERRVQETIERTGMIRDGDCIAVGLSGGKDSSVLLYLLSHLLRDRPAVRLVAITIDEGIAGYREETMKAARSLAADLGVEQIVVSFEDAFGSSLDAFLRKPADPHPCTLCGVLRRRALQTAARRAGATKLATGHSLDDEAEAALMNVLNGDLKRIVRTGIPGDAFVPRIKPLGEVPEKEVTLYAVVQGLFLPLPECPYAGRALRSEARGILSSLEYRHPGTTVQFMEGYTTLREEVARCLEEKGDLEEGGFGRCEECGEPATGRRCQACALLASLAGE
ncbi:TIGR00269 family protein [Methanofollis aquaemaris]|uniref:TIGR00269 family protein n=1 Tax=Methanofollis aquaemaris TaxID=126734 RepID=A0A8A3S357_9EURY|nr:TIGR00269 family protein [Methanofollis aquaemaris]QSZ66181.1 TIGR00269 family protein [Methanofollis aquaemaris]